MSGNIVFVTALFVVAAAAGAAVRQLAGGYLNNEFPIGTLAVNVVASFLLGIVVAAADPLPTVLGIGALGAMSTWSATATEAAAMSRSDQGLLAVAYLGLTVTTGVLAAWFGLRLGPVLF